MWFYSFFALRTVPAAGWWAAGVVAQRHPGSEFYEKV